MRASTASTGTGRRASARSAPPSTMRVRLLAPFDPVVWDRRRFELFWGWPYRFEAYTPLAKRKLGYYALPMLWRDRVVGWANLSVRDGVLQHDARLRRGPAGRRELCRPGSMRSSITFATSWADWLPTDSHGQHRRARSPELRRPRGRDHEPAQGPLPRGRPHQARSRALLPRRRRRRAARRRRPAQRAGPLPERHRRRVLLPEARAASRGPTWIEVVALQLPVRPHRRGGRAARRRRARLDGQPRRASSCTRIRCAPTISIIPDELRVDLDPVPGVEWPQIREVARVVHAALDDLGLVGWPKTSGSRGIHVYVRIEPPLDLRRRCAARRWRWRARSSGARPALATSKWWKEERHGVFLDYNQNAKDRTVAGAYSVRPKPDARVSAPLTWDEIGALRSGATSRCATMPARFAAVGDRHAAIDEHAVLARRAARAVGARTSARASATRPGRRTTASRPASRRASRRRAPQTRRERREVDAKPRPKPPAGRRSIR